MPNSGVPFSSYAPATPGADAQAVNADSAPPAFDVQGALQAGYTDREIVDHLAQGRDFDAPGARQAGYSDREILQHLTGWKPQRSQGGAHFAAPTTPAPEAVTPAEQSAKGKPFSADLLNGPQWRQAGKNVAENAAGLASGAGATALGLGSGYIGEPIRYGAQWLGNKLGVSGTPAPFDPHGVKTAIQNQYTYQPSDRSGQELAQTIGYVPGKILGGIESVGGPGAIDAAEGISLLLPFKGARLPAAKGLVREAAPKNFTPPTPELTPDQLAVKTAMDAGYKLTPTQVGKPIGSVVEGLSGQVPLERSLSKQNQPITNRLAAQEIGLQTGTPLTPRTIAPIKGRANAVYSEVGRLGKVTTDEAYQADVAKLGGKTEGSFPLDVDPRIAKLQEAFSVKEFNAAQAVQKTRELRAASTKNIKAPNAPEQNNLGYAQRAVSDALEAQLERHAQALGKVDLVARFQKARQQLAKVHSVESALSPRGNVSAQILAKMQAKGVPLSGNLKTIADTAQSFGKSLQDAEKLRNTGPIQLVDWVIGGSAFLHHPPLAAAMLARPVIRAGLASDRYQRSLAPANALSAPRGNALLKYAPPAAVGASTNALNDQRRK